MAVACFGKTPDGIAVFRIRIKDFLITADSNIKWAVVLAPSGDVIGTFGLDIDRGLCAWLQRRPAPHRIPPDRPAPKQQPASLLRQNAAINCCRLVRFAFKGQFRGARKRFGVIAHSV